MLPPLDEVLLRIYDDAVGGDLFRNIAVTLYRALAGGHGGTVSLGQIRQILSNLVRNEFAATVGENSTDVMPSELVVQYLVGAYMAVLTWWLDGGAKLPPKRIDAMFRRLAAEGIMPSR